jgi:hypothetical protein
VLSHPIRRKTRLGWGAQVLYFRAVSVNLIRCTPATELTSGAHALSQERILRSRLTNDGQPHKTQTVTGITRQVDSGRKCDGWREKRVESALKPVVRARSHVVNERGD